MIIQSSGADAVSARQSGDLRAGFSLVETVLAMAVMSLAITVLLGLLPHGLEMSRKAGVSAGEARVTSDVMAELSRADWNNLQTYNNQVFFYDDQGVRIENGGERISYAARVSIPAGMRLPGSISDSDTLRRVVVEIASTSSRNFDFGRVGERHISAYTNVLSRLR